MTPYADLPLPPGNLGLPLLGETLAFLRDPLAFAEERQARYGRVYKTGLFGRPTVVFTAPEGIRFLLANEYRYFSVSWPATTARLLGPGSISVAEGDLHKRQRRLFQRAFDRAQLRNLGRQIRGLREQPVAPPGQDLPERHGFHRAAVSDVRNTIPRFPFFRRRRNLREERDSHRSRQGGVAPALPWSTSAMTGQRT